MKKILILIMLIPFLAGCSDYKEVNEMAIISAIGIDYADDEFIVTLETFNNKVDKDSGQVKTYIQTGKDKNIALALEKAADKLSTRAYYSHIKLCVISENVALHYLDKISDFFIRSTYFRENFSLVVSRVEPEKILSIESAENPISSIAINLLLQTNAYADNYALDKKFDIFLGEILEFGKDGALSVINVQNDTIYIDGLAIFKDYNLVNILSNDEATLYNILNGKIKKPVFSLDYEGKSFVIAIYDIKKDLKVTNKNITITGTFKAKIMENNPNFDITNPNILETLNEDFSNYINEEITKFINTLQKNKSDILFLGKNYYINTREKNDKLWQYLQVNSNINVVINKKGLIFNIYETN